MGAKAKGKRTVELGLALLEVLLELGVEVLAEANVREHALQLAGVLKAAGLLQLGDHAALGVVGRRRPIHQSLRQHFGVELLKHVLVLNVLSTGRKKEEGKTRRKEKGEKQRENIKKDFF